MSPPGSRLPASTQAWALDRCLCSVHWEVNVQLHGPMSGMLVTHSIALRSSEASECYLYWLASVGKSRHTFLHQNPLRCTGRGLEGRCHRALCCSQANGKLDSGQRKRQFLKYISEASSCLLFSDTPQRIQRSLEGRFKRASATC